jgi:two-component system sensor histidine kinase/response regulator
LLGWRWLDALHPDDREPTRRLWTASVEGLGLYDVEYRVRRSDGVYRWFKTRGVPIRDGDGHIFKWFGTCTDITDLRQTEEALRESEERFRGTFENAAVGIAHTDASGRLLRVNQKLCDILRYTRQELLTRTLWDVICPEDLTPDHEQLVPLLRGDVSSFSRDHRYVRKDGSLVWVAASISLQRDAAGGPVNTISVMRDITERKRLERELRQAKDVAEAANRAKDEFLANVSHEIRTPMNAILGMTELALDTPLTDDLRQCLRTVKSAADNLLGIINDLLDFSKIEAGKLELDPTGFSLRAALGDTLRALAVRAHRKGLELIYHVLPDVPDGLVGDAGRLRQVLLNLIGNAIKFTEEGEVIVRVDVAGEAPPEGEVGLRFAVRDTGIGVPPDRQERIFRAFEQEDTSTTRRFGGTGLGLTIAGRLVALMGGTITVESEPGRGSTFAFTARFGRQPHPPEPVHARLPVLLRNLPVLVVDDNATNRHILEEWLRGWQMKPEAVADGLAALDALWDAVTRGQPFPLVLLDARMPDTDGLALAAKIRRRAELSATRIVLLTSGDRPGDLTRARELRIDAHLLKPVQQEELLETIFRAMSRAGGEAPWAARAARAPGPVPAPTPAAAPLRILVAEDNEFNAQLLEQLLVRRGHRVRLAGNGREALSLAEAGGFDLLLLDVHMPELDGFQVIQAIREWEVAGGGHLPVIALTARSRREDREQCLAAGMDDFLAKPVGATDLWAAIDRVTRKDEGGRRNDEPEGDVLSCSSVALPPSSLGKGPFDPAALLAACDRDATLLGKMCQAFRACLPDHLSAVRDALRDRDAPRLREAAHKLCGTVAAFSTAAAAGASALEDQAAEGRLDESAPLVDQLDAMGRELLRQVDGLTVDALYHQTGAAGAPDRPPR